MMIEKQIRTLFSAYDHSDTPGCALAVVQDGEILFMGGYGMADLERSVPITARTMFDLASTGKQFSAMLVLMLVHDGLIELETPVRQVLPELPDFCDSIRLRHLLHHTSGLRDYCALMELSDYPDQNFYPEAQLFDLIQRQGRLNFQPGEDFSYSNSGYFLLSPLVQRLSGRPFLELLCERILEPLEMVHTTFTDDFSRLTPWRALGYTPAEDGRFRTAISFCGGFGDGPLLSSVEELARWVQNFYANRLDGGQALIELMETPARLNSGEPTEYGCGLAVREYRGQRQISHSGSWAGYRSQLLRFPEMRLSVILLANLSSLDATEMAAEAADVVLDEAGVYPAAAPAAVSAEPEWVQEEELAGFYRSERTHELLELAVSDGKINLMIDGETAPLSRESEQRLVYQEPARSPIRIEIEAETGALSIQFGEASFEPLARLAPAAELSPPKLKAYLGVYETAELPAPFKILLEGEKLALQIGYAKPVALRPVSKDLFLAGEIDLQFERDDHKKVQKLVVGYGRIHGIECVRVQ